jgi:hypothetical protein
MRMALMLMPEGRKTRSGKSMFRWSVSSVASGQRARPGISNHRGHRSFNPRPRSAEAPDGSRFRQEAVPTAGAPAVGWSEARQPPHRSAHHRLTRNAKARRHQRFEVWLESPTPALSSGLSRLRLSPSVGIDQSTLSAGRDHSASPERAASLGARTVTRHRSKKRATPGKRPYP